jgi:hypothetical protein
MNHLPRLDIVQEKQILRLFVILSETKDLLLLFPRYLRRDTTGTG